MYINYNGTNYPCRCRPGKTMVYRGLPEDFPAPVEGEVILCADDGFRLRVDKSEDYLRQTFEGGVLTLTNVPEPEVVEPGEEEDTEPEPSLEERVGALEESNAEMNEVLDLILSGVTE